MTRIKFLILSSIFLLFYLGANAQERTPYEIKAALTFNFIRYVEWPAEDQLAKYRVGFLGDDESLFDAMKLLGDQKVDNKSIEVIRVKQLNDAPELQVLVVGKKESQDLPKIARFFSQSGTLIVTDDSAQKQSTMINFVYPNLEHVGFEINRFNMVYEGLKVSPDILVLGGSELDVAEVLKEMEASIVESRSQLESQAVRLENQRGEIAQREARLNSQQGQLEALQRNLNMQQKTLSDKQKELDDLQKEYVGLTETLATSREQLRNNNELLSETETEINEKISSIEALSKLIEENKKLLTEQTLDLANKEKEIEQQETALEKQSSTIRTQSGALIFAVIVIISVLSMAVIAYRSMRAKQEAYRTVEERNRELAQVNEELKSTQHHLVESEKFAALGGLVAGVAHEINTPLGVGVTAASHLVDSFEEFEKDYAGGQLKRSSLDKMREDIRETSSIITRNLQRASELVRHFKQVAVDQSSEERREFELEEYLKDVSQSLYPQMKKQGHKITIKAEQEVLLDTYPGALAQVMTNLIMNSILHGFEGITGGEIFVSIATENDQVKIDYSDNGVGISDEQRQRIFDPFYTTKRASGGSGLGMHISYNLMVQKLSGSIRCLASDKGAEFELVFPKVTKA